MKGLAGKVALLAGGGQGMGGATALRLATEGCQVVVGDLRVERAEATAAAIRDRGGTAAAKEFDLADERSVEEFVAFGVETFGGVDLLVNAGAAVGPNSPFSRDNDVVSVDTATWEQTLRINLSGYLFTCRYAIPEMLKRGGGAIVCISSTASVKGLPFKVAYGVSKAGVDSLVRSITNRYAAEGIRANVIAPGRIHTEAAVTSSQERGEPWAEAARFGLLGRAGEPDEIAALAAFLLSEECPFLIGQVIPVNGGSFLSPQ